MFYKNVICLVIGLIIGIRLTDFWDYVKMQKSDKIKWKSSNHTDYTSSQRPDWNSSDSAVAQHVVSLPEFLYNTTRVLCWVMTNPQNHYRKAIHIRNTWGSRCNTLLFMSSDDDPVLDTVKLRVPEGRSFLWYKTREAFNYVYENHFDDADWFMKADDDTYFVMENLRAFLYPFSADAPVYFGCKFHPIVNQGYMSGGAGYVLSKEALRRFGEQGYPNERLCSRFYNQPEDTEMGKCLENIGVVAGNSRDELGRERFLPLAPAHLIPNDTSHWYASYLFYKHEENSFCCSFHAISFHYIKPKEFYTLDYSLYFLRPFGVLNVPDKLPAKKNMTELMDKWRYEPSDNI